MLSVGFEPTIAAIKRLQAYASGRTATGIGWWNTYFLVINMHILPVSIYSAC
jgi:hypothetical protein